MQGSTTQNYRELAILPTRFLYKEIIILFTIKRFIHNKDYKLLEGKKENILHNISIKYLYKPFGQSFVNYLFPVYFNSIPCQYKKNFTILFTIHWLCSQLV